MITNVIQLQLVEYWGDDEGFFPEGQVLHFATKHLSNEELFNLHNGGVYTDTEQCSSWCAVDKFEVDMELVDRGLIEQYWEDDPTEETWEL